MKTKFLSILSIAGAAMLAASCADTWEPNSDKEGEVALSALRVEISAYENMIDVDARADVNTDAFRVAIYRVDADRKVFVQQWEYSAMPEVVALPVGSYMVSVESGLQEPAAWNAPYYAGESDVFEVTAGKISYVETVTCTFRSLKVSVKFRPDLLELMGSDARVRVEVNDQASLTFTLADTARCAYFALPEGSSTLVSYFTGTVSGYEVESHDTYNVVRGEYLVITYKLNSNPSDPGSSDDPNEKDDPDPENPGGDNPGGDDPSGDDPGTGDDPSGDDPSGDDPGTDDPGTDDPKGGSVTPAGISVSAEVTRIGMTYVYDNSEVTEGGSEPTQSGPVSPDQPSTPSNPPTPSEPEGPSNPGGDVTDPSDPDDPSKDEPVTDPIVITPEGLVFAPQKNVVNSSNVDATRVVSMKVDNGIKSLILTITSTNADFALTLDQLMEKSPSKGLDLTDFAESGAILGLFGFDKGLGGMTAVDFDITSFVPLLQAFPGDHTFKFEVSDTKGNKKSESVIIVI